MLVYNCEKLGFIFRITSYLMGLFRIFIPIVLMLLIAIDIAKMVINANLDEKVKKDTTTKIVKRLLYAVIIFLIPTIVTFIFNRISDSNPAGYGNDNSANSWAQCFSQYFRQH